MARAMNCSCGWTVVLRVPPFGSPPDHADLGADGAVRSFMIAKIPFRCKQFTLYERRIQSVVATVI
jgi:hypothetical protein